MGTYLGYMGTWVQVHGYMGTGTWVHGYRYMGTWYMYTWVHKYTYKYRYNTCILECRCICLLVGDLCSTVVQQPHFVLFHPPSPSKKTYTSLPEDRGSGWLDGEVRIISIYRSWTWQVYLREPWVPEEPADSHWFEVGKPCYANVIQDESFSAADRNDWDRREWEVGASSTKVQILPPWCLWETLGKTTIRSYQNRAFQGPDLPGSRCGGQRGQCFVSLFFIFLFFFCIPWLVVGFFQQLPFRDSLLYSLIA